LRFFWRECSKKEKGPAGEFSRRSLKDGGSPDQKVGKREGTEKSLSNGKPSSQRKLHAGRRVYEKEKEKKVSRGMEVTVFSGGCSKRNRALFLGGPAGPQKKKRVLKKEGRWGEEKRAEEKVFLREKSEIRGGKNVSSGGGRC